MDFTELQDRAIAIEKKYTLLNQQQGNRAWTKEHIAQGFIGDVEDLMKLVMAKEGMRMIENVDEKLAHELSDCLWSIIVLAKSYDIDLEQAFMKTMDDLEKHIEKKMQEVK